MKPSTTASKTGQTGKRVATKVVVALFWFAVWQTAYIFTAQEILLVSPVRAFVRLFELSMESLFWRSIGSSCIRVLSGYMVAVMAGTLLAICTALIPVLYQLFSPLLGIIRATPVSSFIILALVWMNTGRIPGFMAFLMVTPMIWANVHTGIKETDPELLEMGRVFRMPVWKKVECIYLPSVMPYFVAACSTGLGFAWKSGIAAEIIALPKDALGKQIYNAKIYLETADLFAWTAAVILLSVIVEKLAVKGLGMMQKRVVKGV